MTDIIITKSMPEKLDEDYTNALFLIKEYRYRKMFKLTEKEYLQETAETVNNLLLVDDTLKQKEKSEVDKASRKGKKR